jgi:hypothetical protein
VTVVAALLAAGPARAQAPQRTVVWRFTPTARAQIALWLESADGARFATVKLTDATARRGIGNRPGASQMNSGYHWPYGRREGVLPVWAHRRAAVAGAKAFPRVIFQDRASEGDASQAERMLAYDSSPEAYFCLSFNAATTRRDGLDAVSCASAFNSDKGRFITATDVMNMYAEPWQQGTAGSSRALELTSLYPPRTDVSPCSGGACVDSTDVDRFASEAHTAMPELDTVTMATPSGGAAQAIELAVPADWPDGDAVAFLEINTEGDYDGSYNDMLFPTPTLPDGAWDSWALMYGYPFRGQPSVVFQLAVHVGSAGTASARDPIGYGSLDGIGAGGGAITALDSSIANDPGLAPGSGADRLLLGSDGVRLTVETKVGPAASDGGADGAGDGGADAAADGGAPAAQLAPGSSRGCGCALAPRGPTAELAAPLALLIVLAARRRRARRRCPGA